MQDISSGKSARLASIKCDGPRVSKYHVDLRSFEDFLKQCLKTPTRYDVIIVDEIGRMEMKSTRFQDCLEKLLESSIPLIASLHNDYIEDYKVWGKILNVTPSNRERIHLEILQEVKKIQPGPPEKPENDKPYKPIKPAAKASIKKPKKPITKSRSKKTKKKQTAKKKKVKLAKPAPKKVVKKKATKKKPAKKQVTKKVPAEKKQAAKKEEKKKEEKKGLFGWIKGKFAS